MTKNFIHLFSFGRLLVVIGLLTSLFSCEERTIFKSTYKQDIITEFRGSYRSTYQAPGQVLNSVNSLVIRYGGKLDQDVTMQVFRRPASGSATGAPVTEPITLTKGTNYKDKEFRMDYYTVEDLVLVLTPTNGAPVTTGKLTIAWGLY